jgi:hypothetical protein
MQYRKKPVVIEAFQLTAETREDNSTWPSWAHEAWNKDHDVIGALFPVGGGFGETDRKLQIFTLEGYHMVRIGDWIIRGVDSQLLNLGLAMMLSNFTTTRRLGKVKCSATKFRCS